MLLKVKDGNGVWQDIPAIKGAKGDTGATGPQGPAGPAGTYTAGNNISISNNTISAVLTGYATESYVNTAISSAITDALGGSY